MIGVPGDGLGETSPFPVSGDRYGAAGGGAAILGKVHGGSLMKGLLTSGGVDLLRHLLGPQYLSILPIILSLVVMLGVSWIRR